MCTSIETLIELFNLANGSALVLVTFLSVVASTFIAFLAWNTSRDAKQIAEQGNLVQSEIHAQRMVAEDDARFDLALAQLFRKIRAYYGPLQRWQDASEEVEIRGRIDPLTEDLAYPPDPSFDSITAEIEVVLLTAKGSRTVVAEEIHDTLMKIQTLRPNPRWLAMTQVIEIVREWRVGKRTQDQAISALRKQATS